MLSRRPLLALLRAASTHPDLYSALAFALSPLTAEPAAARALLSHSGAAALVDALAGAAVWILNGSLAGSGAAAGARPLQTETAFLVIPYIILIHTSVEAAGAAAARHLA